MQGLGRARLIRLRRTGRGAPFEGLRRTPRMTLVLAVASLTLSRLRALGSGELVGFQEDFADFCVFGYPECADHRAALFDQ